MTGISKAALAALLVLASAPSLASAKFRHHHRASVSHATGRAYSVQAASANNPNGYGPRQDYYRADPYGTNGPSSAEFYPPNTADNPYDSNAAPGAAIRRQAIINQNAPGVTNDLAPDNIATATGGPVGGVPGFSSH